MASSADVQHIKQSLVHSHTHLTQIANTLDPRVFAYSTVISHNNYAITNYPQINYLFRSFFRARFLSLAQSKFRLWLANHRAGDLACDWLSIVWAYSMQERQKTGKVNNKDYIKAPHYWLFVRGCNSDCVAGHCSFTCSPSLSCIMYI